MRLRPIATAPNGPTPTHPCLQVRLFYGLLPQRTPWFEARDQPAEMVIDEVFGVPGVGTVVAGTMKRGVLTAATQLLLGPDIGDGSFKVGASEARPSGRGPIRLAKGVRRVGWGRGCAWRLCPTEHPGRLQGGWCGDGTRHCRAPPPQQAAAIKSLHYKRLPVARVVAGQTAAVALKKVKRSQVLEGAGANEPCC
jgi:hypothetical protein